jgi:hypothetical protein
MSDLQHRHYVRIASIIAQLPVDKRLPVASHFANELRGTNPNYSFDRFYSAAIGEPTSGRDSPRG